MWQVHAYTTFIGSIPFGVTLICINEIFVIHMHKYLSYKLNVLTTLTSYVSLNNRVLILLHCRSCLPIQNTGYTSSIFRIFYFYLSLFIPIYILILLSCFSVFASTAHTSLLYFWNFISTNAYTSYKNKNPLSFTCLVQTDGTYNTRVVAVSEQVN
jgi:hypothetical protein